MRRALIALLLALPGGLARAGDFSGAYAGVNAGYAFSRDRNAVSGPVPGESRAAGPDLPPSAAGAASALRRPGRLRAGQASDSR